MNDRKLKRRLQAALRAMQPQDAPPFEATWGKAIERHGLSRSRYKQFAGFAAAAAIAVTAIMLWPLNGNYNNGAYLDADDLMNSTRWIAPSDVLLPEHRFDIYGELPVLIETNDLDEGSML